MNRRDFLKRTFMGAAAGLLGVTAKSPESKSIYNAVTPACPPINEDDLAQLCKIIPQEQEPARLPVPMPEGDAQKIEWYAYQTYGYAVLDNRRILMVDIASS